jgi:hypothetical protein
MKYILHQQSTLRYRQFLYLYHQQQYRNHQYDNYSLTYQNTFRNPLRLIELYLRYPHLSQYL